MAPILSTRLGVYEAIAQIDVGRGGEEVYRARDTKSNRDDAINVLSESFVNDPNRLARFQRKAQVPAEDGDRRRATSVTSSEPDSSRFHHHRQPAPRTHGE